MDFLRRKDDPTRLVSFRHPGLPLTRPPEQDLTRSLKAAPMTSSASARRGFRSPPREAGQAGEHGVRLLEPDVG